jgi:hypothetical protein
MIRNIINIIPPAAKLGEMVADVVSAATVVATVSVAVVVVAAGADVVVDIYNIYIQIIHLCCQIFHSFA